MTGICNHHDTYTQPHILAHKYSIYHTYHIRQRQNLIKVIILTLPPHLPFPLFILTTSEDHQCSNKVINQ